MPTARYSSDKATHENDDAVNLSVSGCWGMRFPDSTAYLYIVFLSHTPRISKSIRRVSNTQNLDLLRIATVLAVEDKAVKTISLDLGADSTPCKRPCPFVSAYCA